MRLDDQRASENIEDRRNQRGGGGFGRGGGGLPIRTGGLGLGGIVIIGLIMLFFPPARQLLPILLGGGGGQVTESQPGEMGAPTDASGQFLAQVLGSTEDVWTQVFASGKMAHYGYQGAYEPTTLVPFTQATGTGCGTGQSAMGPFYCPLDRKVYIDTEFFAQLKNRFGAPGDFAQMYVIAHEVGHHIQTLIGVSDYVQQQRARGSQEQSNALQVRMELQADCFAGVWGRIYGSQTTADGQRRLESGDLEEGLNAAQAIGDDTLQRQSRGYVVPESFTHGSSEQRMRWLKRGFDTADPAQCDTFAARQL